VELAGGPDSEFVVIPTASEKDEVDLERESELFLKGFGVEEVTVLHTRDRAMADTETFVAPLKTARGRLVRGRPAMAAGRFLHGHAHPA